MYVQTSYGQKLINYPFSQTTKNSTESLKQFILPLTIILIPEASFNVTFRSEIATKIYPNVRKREGGL
jgi:hypothetical protein